MNIPNVTLDVLKDFASRAESEDFKGFLDYYMIGCLNGDDGKDYMVTMCVAEGDAAVAKILGIGDDIKTFAFARLIINEEPLRCYTTPKSKIILKGENPEVEMAVYEPGKALKVEYTSNSIIRKLDAFEFIWSPPDDTYKGRYRGKDTSADLEFKPLGPPYWFNQGKEEGAQISPSNLLWGFEMLGNIEGSISIGGKKIGVKGIGINEHTFKPHTSWMEFVWMDWMWFVFDELYGIVFEVQGGNYKEGIVYFIKEKEYLIIKDFYIDHPQWAYSPAFQQYYPINFTADAITDKGTLSVEGDLVRSQPFTKMDRFKPSVHMIGGDMDLKFKGSFTFNDRRTIALNNGRGGNEIIATSNFSQGVG